MPRLKDRQAQVPNGFRYVWASTNWNAQKLFPYQSFDVIVRALMSHVRGMPHQAAQSNMPKDYDSLASLVENYTAKELKREGHTNFIMEDAPNPPSLRPLPSRSQRSSENAVGVAAKTVAGISTFTDWIGSGGRPVAKPLAEARAAICLTCPLNQKGDWKSFFKEQAIAGIMAVLGMKEDLDLHTSREKELGVCAGCGCVLSSKVFVPLVHITANMPPEVKAALNPSNPVCWVLSEEKS